MTLNDKDLRTIERALGIVTGVAKGNPASSVLYDAVEMIDAVLEEAAKKDEEARLAYQEALERSLRPTDYAGTTSVHNLHNALVGEHER